MCYYTYIICETCKAEQKLPPVFCEKLASGIICTKFNSIDTIYDTTYKDLAMVTCQQSFDETTAEVRLFDILRVEVSWIDWTTCSCGLSYIDLDGGCSESIDMDYDTYVSNDNSDYGDVDFDDLWREICVGMDIMQEDN